MPRPGPSRRLSVSIIPCVVARPSASTWLMRIASPAKVCVPRIMPSLAACVTVAAMSAPALAKTDDLGSRFLRLRQVGAEIAGRRAGGGHDRAPCRPSRSTTSLVSRSEVIAETVIDRDEEPAVGAAGNECPAEGLRDRARIGDIMDRGGGAGLVAEPHRAGRAQLRILLRVLATACTISASMSRHVHDRIDMLVVEPVAGDRSGAVGAVLMVRDSSSIGAPSTLPPKSSTAMRAAGGAAHAGQLGIGPDRSEDQPDLGPPHPRSAPACPRIAPRPAAWGRRGSPPQWRQAAGNASTHAWSGRSVGLVVNRRVHDFVAFRHSPDTCRSS